MKMSWWAGFLLAAGIGIGEVAAEPAADFSPVHRSEAFLLHRTIDARLLRGFQIWDARLANWRPAAPTEIAGAGAAERTPLVLLHLWADWCAPCREEFPVLRRFVESLQRTYGDKVRLVLLSETSGAKEMRAFLDKYRSALPVGPLYVDTGEGVAQLLRKDLPTTLPYPATLLLDGDRVVRHAIVGSIAARRAELLFAITRLLSLSASPAKTAAP
jgi:thiol-disulfide isomerase/thioredoxin